MSGVLEFITIGGARTAYRVWDGRPDTGARTILCLHGYPTSSYLWRHVAPRLTQVGQVIAPDLPGFGDSALGDRAGTWEDMVQFLDDFVHVLALPRVDLMVHDWGGLIGLWWLTDHADKVRSLVITDTGFFSDGRWHAFAKTYRLEGEGETLIDALTAEGMANMMRGVSSDMPEDALAEYWKAHATRENRLAKLTLYRSGDFGKLREREWRLADVAPPTCIIWGGRDVFAPVGGGHRFHKRLRESEMHVLERAGHFLQEDAPEEVARIAVDFLRRH